jgi:ATP phosphoribosyltransferase
MVRIALPNKGRLAEDVRELFKDAGLPVLSRGERALSASLGEDFEAIFVRAQDIPEFVADGAAEAGVTGWDLVQESGRTLEVLTDLAFGRCRLVVAATEDSGITELSQVPANARVATCFPRLTRGFFEARGTAVVVVPVSGAAEIAPHLGIADVVVDLTSTGSTLRTNGLREVATVVESSARLVARPGANPAVLELAAGLNSVLAARGKRYLMANVPKALLPAVREALPGLNGPTLSEVLDGGKYVAMHAVVAAGQVYRTVNTLKALGCSGILVTQIERLVP